MDKNKVRKKIDKLYEASKETPLQDDDVRFLMQHLNKNKYSVKYAIYKKHSSKDCYLGVIIDSETHCPRRSGYLNVWEIISTRNLTTVEWKEVCQNYGCNNRRFQLWLYKDIEFLAEEDKLYHVDTPKEFIQKAIELGYTKVFKNPQIKLNFFQNSSL